MLTRRGMILGMGAVAAGASLPLWLGGRRAGPAQPVFFSAVDDDDGRHMIAALDASGEPIRRAVIPERAHSVAVAPDGQAAYFFARRPGRTAWKLALSQDEPVQRIDAAAGRHFFGHGCFSADGQRLYTSENDYARQRGMVVERDTESLAILREFPSHGIGPHDLRLLADGRTLVIANGGIATHPDTPREKLNLDSMQPSLAYVDIDSGALLDAVAPPHHQLSIRHLWVTPDDHVAVAMQFQGPVEEAHPLVGFHRRGEAFRAQLAPLVPQQMMTGYTASICIDPASGVAAVTCPRGNLVTFWNAEKAEFLGRLPARDPGGVNLDPAGRGFIITTSTGELLRARGPEDSELLVAAPGRHWDNHLVTAAG